MVDLSRLVGTGQAPAERRLGIICAFPLQMRNSWQALLSMWKARAATAQCRWVQRDAASTDSVMQYGEGRFLSCSILNKAGFYMRCWSPACAI